MREEKVLHRTRTERDRQKAAEDLRDSLHIINQVIVFKLGSRQAASLALQSSPPHATSTLQQGFVSLFLSLSVHKDYKVFLQPLQSPYELQLFLISFYYFLSLTPFPGIKPLVTGTVISLTSCKNLSAQRSTIRTWGKT